MRLERVLDFLAETKNINTTNILLVPNSKHSSYWEEINSTPAETRTTINFYLKVNIFLTSGKSQLAQSKIFLISYNLTNITVS